MAEVQMEDVTQTYKEDYSSFRTFLWVFLILEFVGSTLFYYSQYKNNKYNFFQSYQQEKERAKADSAIFTKDLQNEKMLLQAIRVVRENTNLEVRYLSRIINLLSDHKKLPDTVSIEKTASFIKIKKIDETIKEGDTIFVITRFEDTLRIVHCIKLKLVHKSFSKFGSSENTNQDDRILEKLQEQEKLARTELNEKIYSREFEYVKRVNAIQRKLESLQNGGSLDLIDFFIFTGNIHTSLGFNGMTPASTSMRLICLIHKIVVIILYYFLLTKFKKKKE